MKRHRRFRLALEQNDYKEAEKLLRELEKWLRAINESAADSLLEAFQELLTLHRLKVPALLRKTLHSTNPIESLFSRVRMCERNIKRYRSSHMAQRWLASVLLYGEKSFRTVKGVAAHENSATSAQLNSATSHGQRWGGFFFSKESEPGARRACKGCFRQGSPRPTSTQRVGLGKTRDVSSVLSILSESLGFLQSRSRSISSSGRIGIAGLRSTL